MRKQRRSRRCLGMRMRIEPLRGMTNAQAEMTNVKALGFGHWAFRLGQWSVFDFHLDGAALADQFNEAAVVEPVLRVFVVEQVGIKESDS